MTAYVGVRTQHPEYQRFAPKWKKIRDVLAANCVPYLRDVGASEPDKKYGSQRQKDYEDGAIFYNFTKRTLAGMVGSVMRKPAEIALSSALEYLLTNCDGAGIGIEQQAQDTLGEVNALSRAGLLVDAPQTAAATRAEQNAGRLNPRIVAYSAENIWNWRKEQRGSTQVLVQVVLREQYQYQDGINEFEWLYGEQFRVLEIYEGAYRQRVFKFDNAGGQRGDIEIIEPNVGGRRLDYIPFTFIGADNNDSTIDAPVLEALADINVGHFRNSADVEESAFICSQPTLMVYPGQNMNVTQFAEANPNGIRLGSRMGHNLGSGGGSELLQASPSNLSKELMLEKENQAVKVGAQLITPSTQITAEAARLQRGADTSIMATIAINVSSAYEQAIKWCAEFLNASGEIVFQLNTEFFMQQMTAQDRAAWIMDINAGLFPQRAYYAAMRAAGVTDWTDEEIEDELLRNPPAPPPALNTEVEGEIPESAEDAEE